MTEQTRPTMTPDEERLHDELTMLRRRRDDDGYRITLQKKPPLHIPGVDDVNHRFNWYLIESPVGDRDNGEFQVEGYVHYEKHVTL